MLTGKESDSNTGDVGSIPGSGRSPREGHPIPLFLPGESHGQRSLAGYSPWGRKKLDTTEVTKQQQITEDVSLTFQIRKKFKNPGK